MSKSLKALIVLMLFLIFVWYFELLRYLQLLFSSEDSFINSYSDKPTKFPNQRVIVSFTTTPDNIGNIKPMLNSLLDQSIKVDMIYLVIPYIYNGQKYNIPEYVKNIASIVPAGTDYGTYTSIIPILLKEKDNDAIIISLKDNIVYGKNFLSFLLDQSYIHPNSLIHSQNSLLFKPSFFKCDITQTDDFTEEWINSCTKDTKKTEVSYLTNYKIK